MNSFYGGGGVESRHAVSSIAGLASVGVSGMACDVIVAASKRQSRSSDLPASPFHGSQSGANPGPSNPAGCQLSPAQRYAMEQSPPEQFTNDYAALSGGH